MSAARSVALLVVAKAPVPGLAKTRLAAGIGDDAAADVAAAALLDTLDAVAATPVAARIVAMTGDLDAAARADEIRARLASFTVLPQRGEDFGERLAHAHADAAAAAPGLPVLQIGMDTPQVDAGLLGACADALCGAGESGGEEVDAVLGPAADGGWWVLGVRRPELARCLRAVPMSTDRTGADTLAALRAVGARVRLVAELADVDTLADVAAVARRCAPNSRFRNVTASVGV